MLRQSAGLLPASRAVLYFLDTSDYSCRIVAARGGSDSGEFRIVRSDEDVERWSIDHYDRARTVRIHLIQKGADDILQ